MFAHHFLSRVHRLYREIGRFSAGANPLAGDATPQQKRHQTITRRCLNRRRSDLCRLLEQELSGGPIRVLAPDGLVSLESGVADHQEWVRRRFGQEVRAWLLPGGQLIVSSSRAQGENLIAQKFLAENGFRDGKVFGDVAIFPRRSAA